MDSVKTAYRYLPVTARYGNGVYTYTFIEDERGVSIRDICQ